MFHLLSVGGERSANEGGDIYIYIKSCLEIVLIVQIEKFEISTFLAHRFSTTARHTHSSFRFFTVLHRD